MTETKELLQKPLQKIWHKVYQSERGGELACAGMWWKTAAEKIKTQCRKYLLVWVDG